MFAQQFFNCAFFWGGDLCFPWPWCLTLTEWAKVLQQSLSTRQVDWVYVDQLVQGLKYVCDAFLDAAPLRSAPLLSKLYGGGDLVGALAKMQVWI